MGPAYVVLDVFNIEVFVPLFLGRVEVLFSIISMFHDIKIIAGYNFPLRDILRDTN